MSGIEGLSCRAADALLTPPRALDGKIWDSGLTNKILLLLVILAPQWRL